MYTWYVSVGVKVESEGHVCGGADILCVQYCMSQPGGKYLKSAGTIRRGSVFDRVIVCEAEDDVSFTSADQRESQRFVSV